MMDMFNWFVVHNMLMHHLKKQQVNYNYAKNTVKTHHLALFSV